MSRRHHPRATKHGFLLLMYLSLFAVLICSLPITAARSSNPSPGSPRILSSCCCVAEVSMVWFVFLPLVGFFKVLGFTASGPAVGSFAAWWMGLYGAAVPAGSLFAAIQAWAMSSSVAWMGMWIYAPVAVGVAWIGALIGL